MLYESIVCPVDFSDSSMRALEYAFSLARETDAHLVVVHVTPQEIDVPFEESAGDTGVTVAEFFQRREDDARQRLKRIVRSEQSYCSRSSASRRARC